MTSTPNLTRRAALAGAAALIAAPAWAQDALAAKGYAVGDAPMGAADAPVTIYEYYSLTCPHCANFHVRSFGEIKEKYVDTGKVRFILRDVYFDQFGLWGSIVARCGGPENYPKLAGMMLERQQEWYGQHVRAFNKTKNPGPIIDELKKIGRLAGMSNDRMNACLSDQALLERLVEDFKTNIAADDVQSTPTFLINGEKVSGALPAADMAAIIDKHL